jgi:catechol 2,3-dioxygenase-like lactoylglutathione lyase family enzyme
MSLPSPLPAKEQIALLPPFAGLDLARIHRVVSPREADTALQVLSREAVLGFDTESKPTFHRDDVSDGPHVVQFATLSGAWIFDLQEPACREAVAALLESTAVVKAGLGLGSDRSQLVRKLGVAIHGLLDLDDVLRQRGYRKSVGVKTAIALLFGQRFNKSKKTTTSNWAQPQLTDAQLLYAANDAYAALWVYHALGNGAAPGTTEDSGAGLPPRRERVRRTVADTGRAPSRNAVDPSSAPRPQDAPTPPSRMPRSIDAAPAVPVRLQPAVPLLRIFDTERAHAFYLDYLGFHLDWEHRYDATAPRYLQVGRGGCLLHLTEHHGDCSPAATVRVPLSGLAGYHREISGRDYPYLRPAVVRMPWGEDVMEVTDPFGNRLRFCEPVADGEGPAQAQVA